MPSLIGNKPNQVPSNGDLGTLAFQDSNAVKITGGDISGNISTSGLNIDSNTLVVDATNNRVGVGTASPSYALQVETPTATGNTVGYFRQGSGAVAVINSTTDLVGFGNGATSGETRIFADGGSGFVTLRTNGSERMRIDSSGNVGIGTSSPGSLLHVAYNTNTTGWQYLANTNTGSSTRASYNIFTNSGGGDLRIEVNNSANTTDVGASGVKIWNHANAVLSLGTNATERMRITSGGRLLVGTTTENTSGGVLQVSNGITFPATQSASSDANTLDDYEEGTWTPTVNATTTNPTVTYATNGQRGYYTKIGRVVYFQAFIGVSTITSGSGDLLCGGLPFTVAGDVNTLRTWGNIVVGTAGVNWGSGKTALVGYARGGETNLYVLALQNDAAWAGIPIGNVANGDELVWSGWYQV